MAPGLVVVLGAVFLVQFGMIAGSTFLPLRLVALGGQPSDVALLTGLGATAEIPAMLASGVIVARLGLRGLFAGSAVVYAACLFSYVVIDSPTIIVATRVLTGAAFAGLVVAAVLSMATLLPRDLQATGQALYQLVGFGSPRSSPTSSAGSCTRRWARSCSVSVGCSCWSAPWSAGWPCRSR